VRERYPVVQGTQQNAPGPVNPYHFLHMLSARLPQGAITVVGNGSACVMGSQAWTVREGQRYVANSGAASMGYDLPAAIGAAIGAGCAEVICVTGDGSIQMNLQELQTILTNRIPVRIFLINNGGYHSIRQSQQNAFPQSALVGIGTQSGDLEFPVMQRLARAYGYVYLSCDDNQKLPSFIDAALGAPAPLIAEVFVDVNQRFEPKSATQKLPDGTLCSPPLYDLAPFLDRDELAQVMGFLKQ
jgi:acetolactate synthase-1/2/3 large subunit